MNQQRFFSSLARAALLAWLPLACHSGVSTELSLAALDSTCRINSDCDDLLVCAYQRCHQACVTTRDCQGGARCVGGDSARHVCQLPAEQSCSASGACPGSEVCGADGQCRDACASNRDCLAEQVCASGTCADPNELGPTGALPVATTNTGPLPCAFNSDCPGALVCLSAVCRVECATDGDCPSGKTCQKSRCRALSAEGAGCFYNSECGVHEVCRAGSCVPAPDAPACDYDSDCLTHGQHCVAGQCQCECAENADCSGAQVCQGSCACASGRVLSGDVTVETESELIQLSDVVAIGGALRLGTSLRGLGSVVSVQLPALERVGTLSVQGAASLTTLSLPQLKSVASLMLSQCPVLETLSLPALTTLGNVSISETGLKSLAGLGHGLTVTGDLSFQKNAALPICAADALAKSLPGWSGTLTNTGNLACSCAGVSCCSGAVCP